MLFLKKVDTFPFLGVTKVLKTFTHREMMFWNPLALWVIMYKANYTFEFGAIVF
jgi:hypothetical protein